MNELATPFVSTPEKPVNTKAYSRLAFMQSGVKLTITPEQPSSHDYGMVGLGEQSANQRS